MTLEEKHRSPLSKTHAGGEVSSERKDRRYISASEVNVRRKAELEKRKLKQKLREEMKRKKLPDYSFDDRVGHIKSIGRKV